MSIHVHAERVQAATRGDAQAIRALVEQLQQPVYNLGVRMLGSHQDAEEATQEALLRVITHLGTFRGESRFSTWVWSIAVRVMLQFQRQRARVPIPIEDFAADLAAGADEKATERLEDAVLLRQVKLGCSRAMLQCLDDDHRLAYVLGEIMEVPGPQAAQALEISPAAYRKRLSRARTQVNANLRQVCGVVNPARACRCHKRIKPAQRLGRLNPRDAVGPSLERVRQQLAEVEKLTRDQIFYRTEPRHEAPEALMRRVQDGLGIRTA